MKKLLIILTTTLFITLTVYGQNLLFFGENSYPCTETITLESKANSNDLKILFARDGTKPLFVVRIAAREEVVFSGKLIIYLDDGTVISCIDKGNHDYVDGFASALYSLTNEQLSKMKNSNINTVRYELKPGPRNPGIGEGNFTASNYGSSTKKESSKKIDFPALLTKFFN